MDIDASFIINSRPVWPIGSDIYVECSLYRERAELWHEAKATPLSHSQLSVLKESRFYDGGCGGSISLPIAWSDDRTVLGSIDEATNSIVYNITIAQVMQPFGIDVVRYAVICREQRTLPIRVQGSINDILKPVHSTEFEESLRGQVEQAQLISSGSKYFLHLKTPTRTIDLRDLNGATFAFTAEICDGNKVLATTEAWYDSRHRAEFSVFLPEMHLMPGIAQLPLQSSEGPLRLRIRSNPELALRNFSVDHYWDGTIEFQLDITTSKTFDNEYIVK